MGALGGSDVWLAKTIADLASPICRCVDEPHPTQAIVRACSRVASRNGAAGYKVMRLIARAMDIDAGPAEPIPHDQEPQKSRVREQLFRARDHPVCRRARGCQGAVDNVYRHRGL